MTKRRKRDSNRDPDVSQYERMMPFQLRSYYCREDKEMIDYLKRHLGASMVRDSSKAWNDFAWKVQKLEKPPDRRTLRLYAMKKEKFEQLPFRIDAYVDLTLYDLEGFYAAVNPKEA